MGLGKVAVVSFCDVVGIGFYAVRCFIVIGYRQLMGLGLPKIPDAVALSPENIHVAIELEREIKTDRRYEAIVGAYITQMKQDNSWQRVDYLCPNRHFASLLARAFGRLKQVRLESKDGTKSKTGSLQQSHLDRFRFYSVEDWPNGKWVQAKLNRKLDAQGLVHESIEQ